MESRRVFFVAHLVFVEVFVRIRPFFKETFFLKGFPPLNLPTDDECWLHGFWVCSYEFYLFDFKGLFIIFQSAVRLQNICFYFEFSCVFALTLAGHPV